LAPPAKPDFEEVASVETVGKEGTVFDAAGDSESQAQAEEPTKPDFESVAPSNFSLKNLMARVWSIVGL
jgi:hypothetical protein